MLRTEISEALKDSMRTKEERATSTLRLILAALKDRDIAARGKGNDEPISDDELVLLLQSMIKQRHDSIAAYTKGGRQDLADGEAEEITIIERFLRAGTHCAAEMQCSKFRCGQATALVAPVQYQQ